MLPLFRRLSQRRLGTYEPLRWSYEPLRWSDDETPCGQKYTAKFWARIAMLAAIPIGVALGVWVLTRIFWRSQYSPLDNYQNLNPLLVTHNSAGHTPINRRAVVSSLYSDGFAIAAAVVGHSALSANVSARLLLPYLESQVSEKALCIARAVGWETYAVPLIPPPHGGQGIHPRFRDQYTKLNIWKLDEMGIDSAVYLDADTLVRRNFDELFDSPFNFAAVPDVYGAGDPRGFSLTFNAGVLAYRPSSVVFEDMRRKMEVAVYPLKQAEQAFLNLYFGGTCMRLPYVYNANLAIKARSSVLWNRLADEMRIVHYTGVKPFLHERKSSNTILSVAEVEEAMDRAARRDNGFFWEEVTWWREAYEQMMLERGDDIRRCYS